MLNSLLQQSVPPRNTAEQSTASAEREHATNPAVVMSPQIGSSSAGEPAGPLSRPPDPGADDSIPLELRQQTKYRIVRLLGRGGMGSVYEVHHQRMDRRQALKVINPELVDNPQALLRFEEEIKAVAKLDHPNIARAYDAESIGSLQAIVMEFVAGRTLHEFLKKRGRLTVVEACRCVRQACLGLQHAHERGLVHRDLKPQNLMLTRDSGIIKILDFGLAKIVSENKGARGLTKTNTTMGTFEYMAPEQAMNAARADIRADIYSLGCTLYYLIAGVLPFAYDSDTQLLLAHQNERPRPLCEIRPETPQELSDLVDRMLAKNPADRPQTPADVGKALLPFATGKIRVPAAEPAVNSALAELLAEVGQKSPQPGPKAAQENLSRPPAGEGREANASPAERRPRRQPAIPPRFRTPGWLVAAGGAALVVVVLFSVLFKMPTPEGTLVVEVSDPEATVQVLDAEGKLLVEQKAGAEKVEIGVVPGKGTLRVVKNDVELVTREFALISGGRETINARLEKRVPPPLGTANRNPPAESEGAAKKVPGAMVATPSAIPPRANDNNSAPIGKWFTMPITPDEVRENWTDTGGGQLTYVDNTLTLQNGMVEYPIRAKDMSIRVKAKKGDGNHIALALRVNPASYYAASFHGGDSFAIFKRVDGEITGIADGHSSRQFNDFFEFEFRVAGDTLTALADGEVVLQCRDQSIHTAGHARIRLKQCSGQFVKIELFIPNKDSLASVDRPLNGVNEAPDAPSEGKDRDFRRQPPSSAGDLAVASP